MTLIFELPEPKEAALKAKGQSYGVSPEQYVQRMMDRELAQEASPSVGFELLTYFSGRGTLLRTKAAVVAHALQDGPDVRLLPQTSESFSAGLQLYSARPDKEYSLTDCILIACMKAEGMTESATADRHFEQEGFRALFR